MGDGRSHAASRGGGGGTLRNEDPTLPFVSVITLNWNGRHYLEKLLPCLEAQSYPRDRFEVIVFDNCSTKDDSVAFVKHSFPDMRVIENGMNDGFARGCNLAMQQAEGDFIVLVNNDTEPDPGWLSALVTCAVEEEGCGAVTSKLLFAGRDTPTINNAGTMLRPGRPWPVEELGYEQPDGPEFAVRREITALCGASLLFNRKMLEDVGLFDEAFFMYFEDTDLAWRGQSAGWRYFYEPTSVIYHEHGGSSIPHSDLWTFYVTRNRMFVLWKNASLRLAAKVTAAFVYLFLLKPLVQLLRGRDGSEQRHRLRMGARVSASFSRTIGLMLLKRYGMAQEKGLGVSPARRHGRHAHDRHVTRIGIYDNYLSTRGGGEKLCLSMASALASEPGNEVFVITSGEADLGELASYFNLDLSRVKVFSFSLNRRVMETLHRASIGVALREFVSDSLVTRSLRRLNLDVFVNATYRSNLPSPSANGYYLCMFPQQPAQSASGRGTAVRAYRQVVDLLYRTFIGVGQESAIDTYGSILSISRFTQGYVQRYWHRDSSLLYPICDDMSDETHGDKGKLILSVGRFFAPDGQSHHKNHALMIEQFAKLETLIKSGWELHLVGSCAQDNQSLLHVVELFKLAQGLPVYFHIDASFEELRRLYNHASIFWHATGYGADADVPPETQEHFGITTGEAMTAGVIPVVIDSAGQQELVEHGVSGFLWSSLTEWRDLTLLVASMDRVDRAAVQGRATKAAQRFGKAAFDQRVRDLFRPTTHEP